MPIGAFYGKGKRTGKYGSFIVASYDKQDMSYESITKRGTGFSDDFLTDITEKLGKTVIDKPSNYLCDLKPDVWFDTSVSQSGRY